MESIELKNATSDYVASAAKAVLGTVPFAGSLLAEIAGSVIPNQRVDRIVKYAVVLEKRLAHLEQESVRYKLSDENFTDLMEESMRQAAQSLSDERRDYIAKLVANSLSSETIKFIESKHLLKLLGEINDIEIIWLRASLIRTIGGDDEFRELHNEILEPIPVHFGVSDQERDKATIQKSYQEHLVHLGLLAKCYSPRIGSIPESYDPITNDRDISGYAVTGTGKLLLRQIGLFPETDDYN